MLHVADGGRVMTKRCKSTLDVEFPTAEGKVVAMQCIENAGHDVEYAGDYSNPSWIEPAIPAVPHRVVIEWEED